MRVVLLASINPSSPPERIYCSYKTFMSCCQIEDYIFSSIHLSVSLLALTPRQTGLAKVVVLLHCTWRSNVNDFSFTKCCSCVLLEAWLLFLDLSAFPSLSRLHCKNGSCLWRVI